MQQERPNHRGGVLGLARKLAKSGAYSSAEGVLTAVREVDGSAPGERWFTDFRFRAQLTQLCELAQRPPKAHPIHR